VTWLSNPSQSIGYFSIGSVNENMAGHSLSCSGKVLDLNVGSRLTIGLEINSRYRVDVLKSTTEARGIFA